MTIEALYEQFKGELTRFAAGMTQDAFAAEDLVQDAFCRALRYEALLIALEPPQARAWLYRTVKNAYVDRVRRGHSEVLTDSPPETGYLPTEPSEREWRMLLESLPPPDGTLLWLHTVEGRTSEQLGAQFGMPAGTVRYRLHNAKKQVRNMLGGTIDGTKNAAD